MGSGIRPRHRTRARMFKALGHPTRLFLVEELSRGERCVCDLMRMVRVDLSTVSKHLKLLREAGILTDRKEGLKVFYRLQVPCIMKFFACLEEVRAAPTTANTLCSSSRKG